MSCQRSTVAQQLFVILSRYLYETTHSARVSIVWYDLSTRDLVRTITKRFPNSRLWWEFVECRYVGKWLAVPSLLSDLGLVKLDVSHVN